MRKLILSFTITSIILILWIEFKIFPTIICDCNSEKINSIISNLALATISASIFYFIDVYLKELQDLKKIKPHIGFLLNNITSRGMATVVHMTNSKINQDSYKKSTLTIDELSQALSESFLDSKINGLSFNKQGEIATIGDLVLVDLYTIKSDIDILFRYIIYLDPKLIYLLNTLMQNSAFEIWPNIYPPRINKVGNLELKSVNDDLSKYSRLLFEFYKIIEEIRLHAKKEYPNKTEELSIKLARAYYEAKDYKKAIQYCKQILKRDEENRNALYMIGISNWNISQKEIALKQLKKALRIHPNWKHQLKNDIKDETIIEEILSRRP